MANATVGITLKLDGDKIIVSGLDQVNRKLTELGDKAQAATARASGNFSAARAGLTSISKQLESIQGLVVGMFSVQMFAGWARQISDTSLAFDRMNRTTEFGSANLADYARNTDFVRQKSRDLGLELISSGDAYAKLSAASRGTTLQGAATKSIFDAVAKASTVMGLSAQDTSGSLLAISQMISKGTVSAEELRGQLGERLPGAFQIAARAMGVTTQELGKMLEQGQLTSEVFLPRFAAQMRTEMAGSVEKAADSVQVNLNRVHSSWQTLQVSISNSKFSNEFLKGVDTALTGINTELQDQKDEWPRLAEMVAKSMAFAADAVGGLWATVQGLGRESKGIDETTSLWLRKQAALVADSQLNGGKNQAAIKKQFEAEQAALDAGYAKDMERIYSGLDKFRTAVDAEIAARKDRANRLALDGRARSAIRSGDGVQAFEDEELLRTKANLAASTKDAAAIKAQAAQYLELGNEIAKTAAMAQAELAAGGKLSEADKYRVQTLEKLIEKYQDGKISLAQYIDLEAQMTDTQGLIAQVEASAALAKANQAAAKSRQADMDAVEKATASLEDQIRKQQDQNASIGQSAEAIAQLTAQRELDKAATLEAMAIKALDRNLDVQKYEATMAQVQAMRQLAAEQARGGSLKAADDLRKANEKAAHESGKYWEDALMRAFESGKGFFESLWDTIKNTLKTQVLKVFIQPVTGAFSAALGLSGAANAATGAAATPGMFSGLMAMGQQVGSAASISMSNGLISGFATNMANIAGQIEAGSFASAAGMALPYLGIGLAGLSVLNNLGVFGSRFTSATESGRARIDYSAAGVGGAAANTTGTQAQIDAQVIATNSLAKSYFDAAKTLGIQALAASFEVGTNTGREGAAPQTVLGVNVGGRSYSSGEISSGDQAGLSLAASRALLTALQASELPKYLSGVFDGITASTATQDQITGALNAATALKGFHDQLQSMPWTQLKDLSYQAAQGLAEAAGGLDKLGTGLGSFYDKFYSDSEKNALLLQNTRSALAALGETMPALDANTRDWYRAEVERAMALDQSVPANARLTAGLLALSGAMDTLAPALQDTAKAAGDTAKAAMAAVTKSVSAEKDRITTLYEAQAKSIQDALTPVEASISKLQSLSDTLKSTLGNMQLAGADGMYRAQAQAQISAALAIARAGGPLPLNGQINTALTTVSQPSERLFATFDDYARDYYRTANDISALNDLTGSELTVQQSTQELLQAQLTNAKQEFDTQIKYLDDTAAMAQAQLDAALGVNASVLSVADAVKSLHQALKPETPKGQSGAGTGAGAGGGVVSFGGGASGSAGDAARYFDTGVNVVGYGAAKTPIFDAERIKVLDYVNANVHENWDGARPNESLATIAQNAMAAGATQRDVAAALGFAEADVRKMFDDAGIPAFANGGLHAGGLRLVGERGMELEATGPSRIFNADQTRDILSGHRRGGGGDEAQLAELRALRDQNAKMLEKMAQMLEKMQAVADSSRSTDRTLNRVTRGGDGMQISSDSTASVLAL